ncbi:hypothetical protein CLOBOL_04630 [Enterocloster bolteae ATCC BAA-613]|uniref:Uncharacterized protein n=1 Tax=Enterocloster bolteae (strain ATCC BAA-613 / DSM 15670 / CCUG 46953 / JCM 12243 / WAL 16351) TaxID=411902 RepID=A8RWM1_ENTBW|nr:hypothetical protein CLOBOL_04630 [Enterocloster bolteae ATCC BAA-613]
MKHPQINYDFHSSFCKNSFPLYDCDAVSLFIFTAFYVFFTIDSRL